MENEMFSFKELYDVHLKLTYPIEIGERKYEPGEIVASFDKIQISNFQEIKSRVTARGGYGNIGRVYWETTKSIQFSFIQGVFSKSQFALLSNSTLKPNVEKVYITKVEEKESNENKTFELSQIPAQKLFIYDKETGKKIQPVSIQDKTVTLENKFQTVIAEYEYEYIGGQVMEVGRRLISGFLELEGKTRVKDDTTGQVVTGLIKIPKLKLMSDLSMRLGSQASPITAGFAAEGIPVGEREEAHVCEIYFLEDDIDSDF